MTSAHIGDMVADLSAADYEIASAVLRGRDLHEPDLIIAPDGAPYLYRWHLLPYKGPQNANVYFHIQTRSDPERPLHDHPWDNYSVILSGGYDELYCSYPAQWRHGKHGDDVRHKYPMRALRRGDTVARKATEAHRLMIPAGIPYTMTLFTSGPKVREWGFWYPDGFHPCYEHVAMRDGVSVHVNREGA